MPAENTSSEKELLLFASTGDEKAFSLLFHAYKDKLFSFILALTKSNQKTEDLIQDIFLKLWTNRESMDKIENFGAYIFRMAQNQCLNAFKRMSNERIAMKEIERRGIVRNFGDADQNLSFKEAQKKLNEALSKLSPQQKLVFTLSREKGLKYDEIASQLNISPSTVKNHLSKALHIVRDHLQDHSTMLRFAGYFILCFFPR